MNTVAKWRCSECGKIFYTDAIGKDNEPVCHCTWDSKIRFLWVDFEPTKRVYDEITNSGNHLVRRFATKKDAWIFSAHALAENDKELQENLDRLPF